MNNIYQPELFADVDNSNIVKQSVTKYSLALDLANICTYSDLENETDRYLYINVPGIKNSSAEDITSFLMSFKNRDEFFNYLVSNPKAINGNVDFIKEHKDNLPICICHKAKGTNKVSKLGFDDEKLVSLSNKLNNIYYVDSYNIPFTDQVLFYDDIFQLLDENREFDKKKILDILAMQKYDLDLNHDGFDIEEIEFNTQKYLKLYMFNKYMLPSTASIKKQNGFKLVLSWYYAFTNNKPYSLDSGYDSYNIKELNHYYDKAHRYISNKIFFKKDKEINYSNLYKYLVLDKIIDNVEIHKKEEKTLVRK